MRTQRFLTLIVIGVLIAACGGAEEDLATDGVASVSDLQEVTSAEELVTDDALDPDDGESNGAQEESALALAACMRENGFDDFPDPSAGADGTFGFRDAAIAGEFDFRDPDTRAQLQACAGEVGFEGGRANRPDPEVISEQLLVYTQCLRDEGLDVGDIEFGAGAGGQGQGQANGDNGRGQAQGQTGPGGDRSARIAQRLGLDLEDPAVAAALETCEAVLEEVISSLGGPGARPAGSDS